MNKHRDCSNRLTYDFDNISSKDYHEITKSVVKEFKLIPHTELINGLDETFQDFILKPIHYWFGVGIFGLATLLMQKILGLNC